MLNVRMSAFLPKPVQSSACFLSVLLSIFVCAGCGGGATTPTANTGGTSTTNSNSYNNLNPNVLPAGISTSSQAVANKNVQILPGWDLCVGSCANAAIPSSYTLTQSVSSPSLNGDGNAASFFEGGTPFGDVMWYNHFGNTTATHFVVDLYLWIDHPENAQAIEIAALRNDGTVWYKMEAQCDYASGKLRGFDEQSFSWTDLGANCVAPKANTWQRITLQYSTTGGTSNYEAASFDGVVQPLSVSLPPASQSNPAQLLGVHFQLDNGATSAGYTAYIDDWTVYSW